MFKALTIGLSTRSLLDGESDLKQLYKDTKFGLQGSIIGLMIKKSNLKAKIKSSLSFRNRK